MTTVEIYRKNGKIIRYRANGHSDDSKEEGHDIVCAALSIILQSPIGGMQDLLEVYPKFDLDDDGHLDVQMDGMPLNNKEKEIDVLLGTMMIMLKELRKEYPKNLKLVEKEVK